MIKTILHHIAIIVGRVNMIDALLKSIGVLLAFLLGGLFTHLHHGFVTYIGSLLACTSCIVVLDQKTMEDSFKKGWLRVVGTFIGALIAYIYLLIYPYSLLGMILGVLLLDIICMMIQIPDNGKMATITLIAVLLISKYSPSMSPLLNGTLRFAESTVGVAIGLGIMWIRIKINNKRHT
ncbi:MAG: FUSC family protein [Marinifilaceae bacterium]